MTDHGSNFKSCMLDNRDNNSIKNNKVTAYHAQCQGPLQCYHHFIVFNIEVIVLLVQYQAQK